MKWKLSRPMSNQDSDHVWDANTFNKAFKVRHCNFFKRAAKCIDGATLAAHKEMLRVIRFVLDTQLFCLKINQRKMK
jgi:hypothetical protein